MELKYKKKERSEIRVGRAEFGKKPVLIAGPCSIESREQIMKTAEFLSGFGVDVLRGGAYKPRSSPYSFQGHGVDALEWFKEAGERYGLATVSEVMDTRKVDLMCEYVDILQIGARNSQNFELLKEVGRTENPVLLKRGFGNTIDEWLNSAEYILSEGNEDVILCERGIRTFEEATRFTFDISAVPVIKEKTHLPIILDPSHASGRREFIKPLCKAAIAVGADGIMLEVHPKPEKAKSDGRQSLRFNDFDELMEEIGPSMTDPISDGAF
ncbi:MAG: 3-deoxy-7-phosphoheptulonate synthase [Candidatus Saliniplasma sp.]